jgi:hypothetical protein
MKQTVPPLYLQLYVYEQKSLLGILCRCLEAQFDSDWNWTVVALSPSGTRRSRRRHTIDRAFSSLADLAPDGMNRSDFLGTREDRSLAARVVFQPSPLSSDWAKIGKIPEGMPRRSRSFLRSLRSSQSYVAGYQITRDPVFISIELTPTGSDNSGRSLFAQFDLFVKCACNLLVRNFVGFIDSSPVLPASMIVGGRPELSVRLDKHFDKPHTVVFGPAIVLEAYWKAAAKTRPKPEVTKKKIGSALVVLFNEPEELRGLDLPEWHTICP